MGGVAAVGRSRWVMQGALRAGVGDVSSIDRVVVVRPRRGEATVRAMRSNI